MPVTPFILGQIVGIVQRPRKLLNPLVHLLLVNRTRPDDYQPATGKIVTAFPDSAPIPRMQE